MRVALILALCLCACGGDSPLSAGVALPGAGGDTPATALVLKSPRPVADAAVPESPRSQPNPLCATDYLGTTGQLQAPPDPGVPLPTALHGGAPASPEIAATLPATVWLRDAQQGFTNTHYVALRDGNLYVKANRELTGIDEPWRALLVPDCLAGHVTEMSVDGTVILALDGARWLYTLDTANYGPMTTGWTRRWGAFFWTDPGEQMPADVRHWATSHYSGGDKTYIDSAGRTHPIFGILTVYLLRGDGLRITYMDPWLPSDESREVCGPERGTRVMRGLSGSGSTVVVITDGGEVYTRLYEFDVSGANSMFFDYSWQDQDAAAAPLMQLPAPEWVRQPRIPGRVTDRISLRQIAPDTAHRVVRVEGLDASGRTGFWEKDLPDAGWRFVATGEALRGTLITGPASGYVPEDLAYAGTIDGYRAEVPAFNPYCSPATLRLFIGDGAPTELVLHSTDGLRQERRARGLDAQPHIYRSAVEVPKALWAARDQQPAAVRDFLAAHFPQRFLTGPLSATPDALQITMPCWTLTREASTGLPPMTVPDLGIYVAELRSAQEEGRAPGACAPF